jgi:hypothetical protein
MGFIDEHPTDLPDGKITLNEVPEDADPDNYLDADEWNEVMQALDDVHDWIRGATWYGLAPQAVDPAPSGIADYVWLDEDGIVWRVTGGDSHRLYGAYADGATITGTGTEDDPFVAAGSGATFGSPWFGDGSDGAATLDGVATVLGMAPVANVYTMTRGLNLTSLSISTGVTLRPDGFPLHVSGTITGAGTAKIERNGGNASGQTAGAAPSGTSRQLAGGTTGGTGGNTGGAGAGSGTSATANVCRTTTNSTSGVGGLGSTGAAGPVPCRGGAGGRGDLGSAGDSGNTSVPYTAPGGRWTVDDWIRGRPFSNDGGANLGTIFQGGTGGGGGGGANATNVGGGGGGGGGVLVVCAHTLAGTLAIEAKGGNGAQGAGANAGGGGGGGGGVLVLLYGTKGASVTPSVAGGTAGAAQSGTSGAGGAGATGILIAYNISGDGT